MNTEASAIGDYQYQEDVDGSTYHYGSTNRDKTPYMPRRGRMTPTSGQSGRSSVHKDALFQSTGKPVGSEMSPPQDYSYSDHSDSSEAVNRMTSTFSKLKNKLTSYMVRENISLASIGASLGLLLITLFMTMVRSVDFVVYIRLATQMRNYDFIFSGILLTVGFNVICWPVVAFLTFVTGDIRRDSWRPSTIFKCMLMGLMDFLNVVLSTIPAIFVSGSINLVMAQSVILINVFFSFVFLHHRYKITHIIGLVLLIIGIIVAIGPLFWSSTPSLGEGDVNVFVRIVCIIVLFVSYIPMAISNVIKEKYLKDLNLNVWFVNAWVALFQLVFGILLVPTVLIPLPKPGVYIYPYQFFGYIYESIKCIGGINTKTVFNSGIGERDSCEGVFYIFFLFLLLNMTYNILMLVVFKRGSSTLAVVGSTARLAMSSFLFLWGWIAGPAQQKELKLTDYISLIILILGVIVYGLRKEKMAAKSDVFRKLVTMCIEVFPCWKPKRATAEETQAIYNNGNNSSHHGHIIATSDEEDDFPQQKKIFPDSASKY